LHALENNVPRLAQDHLLAQELSQRLGALPGLESDPALVQTNIAMVQVTHSDYDAQALVEALGREGVLVMAMGERRLRFVTHLDVGPEDLDRLEKAARDILG
jgi:threonine aldolase